MTLWGWLDNVKQFINTVIDRVLGRDAEHTLLDKVIDIGKDDTLKTSGTLFDDAITLGRWETDMRQIIKDTYIQCYLMGIGGEGQLSQKDFGSIGGMLADQYRYLNGFAQEIADGKLTPAQIEARIQMYINSARESYSRARARSYGIPDGKLPAHPGDGRTRCLCITTPDCRILTMNGWVPMYDVQVGDYVFTHLNNWKKVTEVVIKSSKNEDHSSYEEHYLVKSPMGKWVGCTGSHLWKTYKGWISTDQIYKEKLSISPSVVCAFEFDGFINENVANAECRLMDDNPYELIRSPHISRSLRKFEQITYGRKSKSYHPIREYIGDNPEIIHVGKLTGDTLVYDITVEDDESFVIEGLISHNTNCKCFWDIVQVSDGWECYWVVNRGAENCDDCLEHGIKWNPFFIPFKDEE
jgi:hypothetical protein